MKLFIVVSTCPLIRQVFVFRTLDTAVFLKTEMDKDTCNAGSYCRGESHHTMREVRISSKSLNAYMEKNVIDADTDMPFIRGGFSKLFPPAVCARVKEFRKNNKLTQKEFSDIIDIYPEALSYFERYVWDKVSPAQMRKILDFFDCVYFIMNTNEGNFVILSYDGVEIKNNKFGGGDVN